MIIQQQFINSYLIVGGKEKFRRSPTTEKRRESNHEREIGANVCIRADPAAAAAAVLTSTAALYTLSEPVRWAAKQYWVSGSAIFALTTKEREREREELSLPRVRARPLKAPSGH